MTLPLVPAVLNELLARESQSLAPRLFESTVFVSRLSVGAHPIAKRMAEACNRNSAALAALILELGGVPGLRVGDVRTADLHYQDLQAVLPRLIADHESLIASYRLAATRVSGEPAAAKLLGDILLRHERDLADLRALSEHWRVKAS